MMFMIMCIVKDATMESFPDLVCRLIKSSAIKKRVTHALTPHGITNTITLHSMVFLSVLQCLHKRDVGQLLEGLAF